MISNAFRWALALMAGTFVPVAWACFPAPDAKPKHEITVIELAQHRIGPTVVFVSEGFAIHVTAEGLVSELSKSHMTVAKPNDLADALRAQMPLGGDLNTRDLVAALFSDPGPADREAQRGHRRFVRYAENRLQYAFSYFLQAGTAVVVETSTGHTLARIKLDTFSEICHGGRVFMNSEDKQILSVVDWIS